MLEQRAAVKQSARHSSQLAETHRDTNKQPHSLRTLTLLGSVGGHHLDGVPRNRVGGVSARWLDKMRMAQPTGRLVPPDNVTGWLGVCEHVCVRVA